MKLPNLPYASSVSYSKYIWTTIKLVKLLTWLHLPIYIRFPECSHPQSAQTKKLGRRNPTSQPFHGMFIVWRNTNKIFPVDLTTFFHVYLMRQLQKNTRHWIPMMQSFFSYVPAKALKYIQGLVRFQLVRSPV